MSANLSPLADDIDCLQHAADAAGIVIYPGQNSRSFEDAKRVNVRAEVLAGLSGELEKRRMSPRDYSLIDVEAVWLLKVAQLLVLHRADGNAAKAERFQKLGEYLRAAVEVDLVNARKSLAVMG